MPEYLDDPSVLTKDKLKSELLAHNVELPSGNPTKDVYVQLYLKKLTAQNRHVTAATLDAFSSDEELPPPVVSSRSRSSGKKATRKTDKVRLDELDVTLLTDQGLKDELAKHGVDVGPIVATTRKLYEKKLQKLLDDGAVAQPPLTQLVIAETELNNNGNSESELYSDKEDEVTVEPEPVPEPEPIAEPEPAPVVERPLGSRGKTPITTRSHSSQHQKVEKIAASDQTPKVEEKDVLKELLPNNFNSPTGIIATCRRPIKGAADCPVKSSDLWNNENSLFSPKITKTTSSSSFYSESRLINRVNSLPSSTAFNSSTSTSTSISTSSSRPLSAAPPAGKPKASTRSMSLRIKLFLLAIMAVFLFLVYQAMETNTINPFVGSDTEVATDSTA